MLEFLNVAVCAGALDHFGGLARTEEFEHVGRGADEVVIGGGVFEIHCIGHVKTEARRHSPGTFGMDNGAAGDFELGDDVIDGAGVFGITGGKNARRFAEAILDEIDIVDVEIQERAAGAGALGEMFLAPVRRLGHATEAGAENAAVGIVCNCLLEPGPFRPEAEAHGGHRKYATTFCGAGVGGHLGGCLGIARERFLANDVFTGAEGSGEHFRVLQGGRANIDQIDGGIVEQIIEVARAFNLGHVEAHGIVGVDVATNVGEIAIEAASAGIADSMDLRLWNLAIGFDVGRGHEAETDDADVDCT